MEENENKITEKKKIGRPVGSVNANNRELYGIIHKVFQASGGWETMLEWMMKCDEHKSIFYSRILAKLIPTNVKVESNISLIGLIESMQKGERILRDGKLIEAEKVETNEVKVTSKETKKKDTEKNSE